MNNKVNFLRGTATEYEASTKDNDTFYYTTDTKKLYLGETEITGGGVTIDDTLSDTSKNPVQNKIITNALNTKANLTDIPTTLPADGGNSDTVGNKGISQILAVKGWFDGNMDDLKEIGSYIVNEATHMPIPGGWGTVLVYAGGTGSVVQVFTAYVTSPSDLCKTYIRHFTGDLWSDWVNISDGGNADTVDGKHASDFSQIISFGTTPTDTKTAIGIQYKTTTYWCQAWTDYPAGLKDGQGVIIAVNYKSTSDGSIWCRQIYISPQSNTKIYQRIISGTDIGEWINIADGGNADTANTAGTLTITLSNECLRNISAGTEDLSAGVSELATGAIYLVYE